VKVPRLKEWRETRGETQVSLAERAGVTQYTVLRAEHGENMRPSTARRLAEELGITVSDLQEEPPVPLGFAGKVVAPDTGRPSKERYASYGFYWSPYEDYNYERELYGATDRLQEIWTSLKGDVFEGARVKLIDDGEAFWVAVEVPASKAEEAWEALGWAPDRNLAPDKILD
jgi:transcriptional regulator with XRE-family HTH domain